MKLNLGPGTHYAEGWINLDAHEGGNVVCDRVIDPADPFADFESGSADQVFLGHVLEHVPWPDVDRLLRQVRAVLHPERGQVLATGPDVYRSIQLYRRGELSWGLLESVLEHADRGDDEWPEAVHKWNCHEARMVHAFQRAEFRSVLAAFGPDDFGTNWPVVNWSSWQCAVRATL